MMQEPAPLGLERDIRQRSLVPPERLAACHAVVIGVGAIGRQVVLQLAAMGMPEMTLFDDDLVGVENLAPQGYLAEDVGKFKVAASAELCRQLHPSVQVHAVATRFKRSTVKAIVKGKPVIVFACVDSIGTRKLLWEALRYQAAFFVDGRMSAEVVRVLAVETPATDTGYAKTLFDAREAFVGPCTARSTIYTASIAAGLMVSQMTKWLRGLPVDADLTFNLLASELTLGSTPLD
jgi:sulfur carrier protein ThiS adenylyltransferase